METGRGRSSTMKFLTQSATITAAAVTISIVLFGPMARETALGVARAEVTREVSHLQAQILSELHHLREELERLRNLVESQLLQPRPTSEHRTR